MEVTEGNIRVSTRPDLYVADKPLGYYFGDAQKGAIIERELLALVNRITQLRDENQKLRKELDNAAAD
jgi:hypothetical protein